MEKNNKTNNGRWVTRTGELFSAISNMVLPNPKTGNLEIRNNGENWSNLVNTLFKIARGKENCFFNSSNAATGLKQIVTWTGGKMKELKYICPALPSYDRYFEPFVGGGSVFMGLNANEHYINDLSVDLISLYRYISTSDKDFMNYIRRIDGTWNAAKNFCESHKLFFTKQANDFRNGFLSEIEVRSNVSIFCEKIKNDVMAINEPFNDLPCILFRETIKFICKRIKTIKKFHIIDDHEIIENIETGVKSALFKNFCNLYNDNDIKKKNPQLHIALFLFLKQMVYAGMFRVNKKGEFNSPYGGIDKNKKCLIDKLNYYRSSPLINHFKHTHIYNLDFEDFLRETNPSENDFIFLDPPYDCVFSSYEGNEFNQEDHLRLANYLLNDCKAKWMMIIGKTDFIYNLYNRPGLYIHSYGKTYSCNFKNNFDRNITHLLITNYPVSLETETLLRAA